ncbi:MAG: hypothetical protein HKN47_03330 [Pirellulaceae bacterium]|nr:hypothetical protein [Pirellulaceae bacterium]
MTHSFLKRLRRMALAALIAGSFTGLTSSPIDPSFQNVFAAEIQSDPVALEPAELCGWVEESTCNYVPPAPIATTPMSAQRVTANPVAIDVPSEIVDHGDALGTHDSIALRTRTSTSFESSIAAIAATACASAGISVEQLIEPFAMVGPNESSSIDSIEALEHWWEQAKTATNAQFEANKTNNRVANSDASPTGDTRSAGNVQESSATAADAVASEVSSRDDAVLNIVSFVPIVDFSSELELSDSWAPLLASASNADVVRPAKNDLPFPLDWDHRDDDQCPEVVIDDETAQALERLANDDAMNAPERHLQSFGKSVLVDSLARDHHSAANGVATKTPFAGSSAMIATIDQVYMPYDLAARDLHVDSLFSLAKRPFCIRSRVELSELPLARSPYAPNVSNEHDELDRNSAMEADTHFAHSETADCLLEEWIWHAESVVAVDNDFRDWLRPKKFGQKVADVVVSSSQVAEVVAQRLALVWPDAEPQPLRPAGAQLLARAGAQPTNAAANPVDTEQVSPQRSSVDPDQLLAQWIKTAASVISIAQQQFCDFTATPIVIAAKRKKPSPARSDIPGSESSPTRR